MCRVIAVSVLRKLFRGFIGRILVFRVRLLEAEGDVCGYILSDIEIGIIHSPLPT